MDFGISYQEQTLYRVDFKSANGNITRQRTTTSIVNAVKMINRLLKEGATIYGLIQIEEKPLDFEPLLSLGQNELRTATAHNFAKQPTPK